MINVVYFPRKIIFIFIFLFIFVSQSYGEENFLTLDGCLFMAYKRNPTFLMKYETLREYNEKESQAFGDMLPQVDFSETLTNYIQDSYELYKSSATISQSIFDGKSLYESHKISKVNQKIGILDVQRQAQILTLQVKKAWYEILKSKEYLKEAEEALERLQQHVLNAEQFYKEGWIWHTDVLQAQVKVAKGEQSLISAQNDLTIAKSKLNVLLHRTVDAPIETDDELAYDDYTMTLGHAKEMALKMRPDLMQAKFTSKNSKSSIIVAKSDLWPSVDASLIASRSGDQLLMDEGTDETKGTISVSWNVWDWGDTKSDIAIAQAQLNTDNLKVIALKDQILLEVQEAWLNMQQATKQVAVLKEALKNGEENFRVNKIRYKERLGTANDVLDAHDLLSSTRKDYISALTDHLVSVATLKQAIGEKINLD